MEKITQANIEAALRYKVEEIRRKPEYLWADDRRNHKVNNGGEAAVKAAVANCALDFDLWKGLRNPALIGRHPVGLRDIWEYYASIILFDAQEPITDGSEGVVHLTQAWRERIESLSDFTDVRPEVNRQRYCTYIPDQGWEEECGLCVQYCPSGAVGNSVLQPNGEYAEAIARQAFQFSDGYLQFDFAGAWRTELRRHSSIPTTSAPAAWPSAPPGAREGSRLQVGSLCSCTDRLEE